MTIKKQVSTISHRLSEPCIVCREFTAVIFTTVGGKQYNRCQICEATFLEPQHRLPIEDERAQYKLHHNDPADNHYRRFLSKVSDPLLERLPHRSTGLDYGCGSGPALAAMLGDAGHGMSLYDPLFYPDTQPLNDTYDFITCTETIEHFHRPAEEFAHFDRMLRPGGWLALSTCFQTEDHRFAMWHYRRDPTHVVFYRDTTLRHLARHFGWRCDIPLKNVVLMQKPC